jgi:hypothetical protein
MNSRDAAYDEEEQLRRAIEASKEENALDDEDDVELGIRRLKRSRDDDEECVLTEDDYTPDTHAVTNDSAFRQLDNKRQKTNSRSPSPSGDQVPMASGDESDDELGLRNGFSKKSSRNAARSQRERAERDERREEQERKRAEAASKRKGRAERRRVDGITTTATTIVVKFSEADVDVDTESDPSEEMPLAARVTVNRTIESTHPPEPPPSSQPAPDTPPANQAPTSSHKKKVTSQHKKKGRNQYTKDRDTRDNDESPARSMSRDVHRNQDEHGPPPPKPSSHETGSKHNSKSKTGMNSKVTMSDMKRRANNILEFITRTQVDLVNEPLSDKNSPQHSAIEDSTATDVPPSRANGSSRPAKETKQVTNGASKSSDFKELSCVEMMDSLTRDLLKWQQEFTA